MTKTARMPETQLFEAAFGSSQYISILCLIRISFQTQKDQRKPFPSIDIVLCSRRFFQKTIDAMETDGSLEERWFACEALADAVNTFLQRKAIQLH
jgi:hypothetical protein